MALLLIATTAGGGPSAVPRARAVLEAEAGAFRSWGLTVGDRVEVKE